MKQLSIFGNWKSHKTFDEAQEWFAQFSSSVNPDKQIILFVPYILLPLLQEQAKNKGIALGSQNISQFPEGPYTGEVTARQVKAYASYVLIGHSERRTHFQETDEILIEKVKRAKEQNLEIIYCVPDAEAHIPEGVAYVAYEPLGAIGTGNPDTPENANAVAESIKTRNPHVTTVVYGGSVTSQNVRSFTSQDLLDGVLPGSASLDPQEFAQIISYA